MKTIQDPTNLIRDPICIGREAERSTTVNCLRTPRSVVQLLLLYRIMSTFRRGP